MADDFTGVPADDWHALRGDMRSVTNLALLALLLFALLVMTLIDKGVLSGWADLLRTAHE